MPMAPPTMTSDADMPPMPPMPPAMDMKMPTMHAVFFWGHRVQVLFSGWPGDDRDGAGMYVLCLLVVAALAALVEALAAWSRALSGRGGGSDDDAALGWWRRLQATWIHVVKVGLSYLLMLVAMSFNGGVFLAVLAGHAAGFLLAQRWTTMHRPAQATRHDDGATNGALPPSEPKP